MKVAGRSTNRSATASTKKASKPSTKSPFELHGESLQRLLTTEEVALVFGVAPATIQWWRSQKCGPPFVRLGRGRRAAIRYRPEAIQAYIEEMEKAEL
nr:helix-turn-helix domain-containing protein [Microvirga sp. KLBC 81]